MLNRGKRSVNLINYNYINKVNEESQRILTRAGKIERFQPTNITITDEDLIQLECENVELLNENISSENLNNVFEIYLYGIKRSDHQYELSTEGLTLYVNFIEEITEFPEDLQTINFDLIGKIYSTI